MYGLQSVDVLMVFLGDEATEKEFSVYCLLFVLDAILPSPISRSLILDVVFILERTDFQNAFGFDCRSWTRLCS